MPSLVGSEMCIRDSIYVMTTQPSALVPSCHLFVAVANVACSYCVLQIVSTWIGPYRLAQQTQELQEGHFTPYDHAFTLRQQLHTEPIEMLTIWLVSPRNRPRNRPTDVRFRFRFFSVSFKKPTETDRLFGENPKNRPSHSLLSVHNSQPWCSLQTSKFLACVTYIVVYTTVSYTHLTLPTILRV